MAAKQQGLPPPSISNEKIQEEFEDFYEEIFEELGKFGEIDELHICDNLGDHMIGPLSISFHFHDVLYGFPASPRGGTPLSWSLDSFLNFHRWLADRPLLLPASRCFLFLLLL